MVKSLKLDMYDPVDLSIIEPLNTYLKTADLSEHCGSNEFFRGKNDTFKGSQFLLIPNKIFCDTSYRNKLSLSKVEYIDLIYPIAEHMKQQVVKYIGEGYVPYNAEINIIPPGGKIKPHIDNHYASSGPRLHTVLFTNPDVKFIITRESFHFESGTCFQFNNKLIHSVENNSKIDSRGHLVIDFMKE